MPGNSHEEEMRSRGRKWIVEGSPLHVISDDLRLDIGYEIRSRLKTLPSGRRLVVLDSGCGHEAGAVRELVQMFRKEVEKGRLEIHGIHLASSRSWNAFLENHRGSGVIFHNKTLREFADTGIHPDIIYDHFGAIAHEPSRRRELASTYVRILKSKGVLAFHIPREVFDRRNDPHHWGLPSTVRVVNLGETESDIGAGDDMVSKVFHIRKH
ncbi:hypothetical protein KJ765_02215 [Candidatus Micrarchaeota archaeon]|nr:hypothetical protein [Candidatus Micrarchaeota archaeon]